MSYSLGYDIRENIIMSSKSKLSCLKNRARWAYNEYCLFCCFTSNVNSYGHGGTVS